jgi:short-subunit dehydrogenase
LRKNSSRGSRGKPVVWVTGASRGIGRETAKRFAAVGTLVVATSRSRRDLEGLVREIALKGGRAIAFVCDVTSSRSVTSTARRVLRRFGRVDALVNNAGATYFKSLRETSQLEFDEVIAANLRGTFLCTKAVIDSMVRRRSGHIINIISVAALKSFADSAAYSASKAGVLALTNVLREEVRRFNIKVTAVIPGATKTHMWAKSTRDKHGHRMMSVEDVARIVVEVFQAPKRAHIEEIVVRPQLGDIP